MVKFILPKVEKRVAAVYMMKFDTGYFYIGSSKNVKQRMWKWKYVLETKQRKNLEMMRVFEKVESVEFELLEIVSDSSFCRPREDFYIKLHWDNELLLNRSPNAYTNKGLKPTEGKLSTANAQNKKKVVKIDTGGNILETYESMAECCRINNLTSRGLSKVLRFYGRTTRGNVYRRLNNDGNIIVPPVRPKVKRKTGYKFSEKGRASMKQKYKERMSQPDYVPVAHSKAVSQYLKDGTLVTTHQSIWAAVRSIGGNDCKNLKRLLSGKRGKSLHGFVWKYA